jgi:hypothetical protein
MPYLRKTSKQFFGIFRVSTRCRLFLFGWCMYVFHNSNARITSPIISNSAVVRIAYIAVLWIIVVRLWIGCLPILLTFLLDNFSRWRSINIVLIVSLFSGIIYNFVSSVCCTEGSHYFAWARLVFLNEVMLACTGRCPKLVKCWSDYLIFRFG